MSLLLHSCSRSIIISLTLPVLLFFFLIQFALNLSIFPHVSTDLSIAMFVSPKSFSCVVIKLSFVNLSVSPGKCPPSVFDIIWVISFKLIPILWLPNTFSFSYSLFKTSLEYAAVAPLVNSLSVKLVVNVVARVCISVGEFFNTISILNTWFDFSFVVKSVTVEYDCLACLLSVFKISHILVAILINMLSVSMRLAVFPLSIICNKIFVIWCLIDDLYNPLSVSVAIFEATEIVIFAWHVLEAKPVLFCFTWKVCIPLA